MHTAPRLCSVEKKERYRSEQEVAVAGRHIEIRRGVRLYHYHCSWCGDWHLTSKPNDES
jgi:hypothetical protein